MGQEGRGGVHKLHSIHDDGLLLLPSFYTILRNAMDDNASQAWMDHMEIPASFCEKFLVGLDSAVTCGIYTSTEVSLKGPSGKIWHVTLQRDMTNDNYKFETGWRKFATDHSLSAGNLLIFRLMCRNQFIVEVFGNDGFQKTETCSIAHFRFFPSDSEHPSKRKMNDLVSFKCCSLGASNNKKLKLEGSKKPNNLLGASAEQPIAIDDEEDCLVSNVVSRDTFAKGFPEADAARQMPMSRLSADPMFAAKPDLCCNDKQMDAMERALSPTRASIHLHTNEGHSMMVAEHYESSCVSEKVEQEKLTPLLESSSHYYINPCHTNISGEDIVPCEKFLQLSTEVTLEVSPLQGGERHRSLEMQPVENMHGRQIYNPQVQPVAEAERKMLIDAAKSHKTSFPATRKIIGTSDMSSTFSLEKVFAKNRESRIVKTQRMQPQNASSNQNRMMRGALSKGDDRMLIQDRKRNVGFACKSTEEYPKESQSVEVQIVKDRLNDCKSHTVSLSSKESFWTSSCYEGSSQEASKMMNQLAENTQGFIPGAIDSPERLTSHCGKDASPFAIDLNGLRKGNHGIDTTDMHKSRRDFKDMSDLECCPEKQFVIAAADADAHVNVPSVATPKKTCEIPRFLSKKKQALPISVAKSHCLKSRQQEGIMNCKSAANLFERDLKVITQTGEFVQCDIKLTATHMVDDNLGRRGVQHSKCNQIKVLDGHELQLDIIDAGLHPNVIAVKVEKEKCYYEVERLISRRKGKNLDEFLVELVEKAIPDDETRLVEKEDGAWWIPYSHFRDGFTTCCL